MNDRRLFYNMTDAMVARRLTLRFLNDMLIEALRLQTVNITRISWVFKYRIYF